MTKSLVGLSLVVLAGCAQADPAAELVQSLQRIQSYQANFVQNIKDGNGQPVSKTQGQMSVLRPGKFYWKSQSPDPILVVADGKFLWTYDIDLAQVTKQAQKRALGNSPAMLLAGSVDKLAEDFTITQANKGDCVKSDRCYALQPVKKDQQFSQVLIGFSQDKLTEIRMHDPLGQNIYTAFTNVKVNQSLNKKLFSFVPPKGVDIIQGGK